MNDSIPVPQSFDIGGINITRVSGGANRADGGGMNGILPKVIWERWYPADEQNRILLDTHCLVVETGAHTVLVESGCGNKLTDKERAFYGVEGEEWIGPNLEAAGFSLDSIDRVLLTHLHTDHAGGVVMFDRDKNPVPTFPNANVYVSAVEFEDADSGYGISPNAYSPVNYMPLLELDLFERVLPDTEIVEGIRYLSTPGHTRGHQSVLIEGEKQTVLFTGDALPLAHHAVPHFNMAYDVEPVQKAETKKSFLEEAHRKGWILVLAHEPNTPVCKVKFNEAKKRLEIVSWEGAAMRNLDTGKRLS